ncbi:hypothetical protein V6N13_129822 [Hibiscus sabdariffa]
MILFSSPHSRTRPLTLFSDPHYSYENHKKKLLSSPHRLKVHCSISIIKPYEIEDNEKELEHSSLQEKLDMELKELDKRLEQKEAKPNVPRPDQRKKRRKPEILLVPVAPTALQQDDAESGNPKNVDPPQKPDICPSESDIPSKLPRAMRASSSNDRKC